jgi:succinate dehydrogenase hydrophobic anchor subunit
LSDTVDAQKTPNKGEGVTGGLRLRVVVEDYVHRPLLLLAVKGLVFVLFLFVLSAGTVIIFELFK